MKRWQFVLTSSAFLLACGNNSGGGGAGGGPASLTGGTTAVGAGGTVAKNSAGGSGGVALGGTSNVSSGAGGVSSGGTLGTGGAAGVVGGTAGTGGIATTGAGNGGATTAAGGKSGATGGGAQTGGVASGTGGTKAMASSGGAATGGSKAVASSGSGGTSTGGGSATGSGGTGAGGGTVACPVISDFDNWPSGKSPLEIGKAAVNLFKGHATDSLSSLGGGLYAWTFAYFASLQFTKLTGDTNNSSLISNFDCNQQGAYNGSDAGVDYRAWGDLPLEVFLEKQDAKCKALGLLRADAQWAGAADDAVTLDARYWSDDMYMITGLQDFGYRATQNQKYLTHAVVTMKAYLNAGLQQNDGLFAHTKATQAKWGRANGWFAAGMALLLQELPNDSDRDFIMTHYQSQMQGLVGVQIKDGTDAGCWRQVLDRTDAGAESSCTAMFTYALVTGVKNGWLTDAQSIAAAKSGWTALGNKTDSTGQLSQVCPGTGQASDQSGVGSDLTSQQNYYIGLEKTFQAGDQHGQAPLLWSAIALLRADCPGLR